MKINYLMLGKRVFFTISLVFYSILNGLCQCKCSSFEVFLSDIDTLGTNIRNEPNGKILYTIKNNIEEEDYNILKVIGSKDNWLKIKPTIGDKDKPNYVYAELTSASTNNYSKQEYCLYESPHINSKVIIDFEKELVVKVHSCCNEWVLISITISGKVYKGWLESNKLCGNPYTTCN